MEPCTSGYYHTQIMSRRNSRERFQESGSALRRTFGRGMIYSTTGLRFSDPTAERSRERTARAVRVTPG
jgi:hypothetical protein